MSFKTELCLKVIGDQAYELIKPLVYDNGLILIQVNPKFDFDGASIPKALWGVIGSPMTGGYQRSACLHDALYACEYFERHICDALFLEAMKSDGVSYFKRYAMYNAVRLFGGLVWKNHKKDEVNAYNRFITCINLV